MYRFKEYPKMVYGPKGQTKVINSPDELPDGFMSYDEFSKQGFSNASADAAAGAVQAAEAAASRKAAEDAAAARALAEKEKAEAEAAEKEAIEAERARIKARLEENNVEFAPQLGLQKLQELEEKLDAYLAQQANDAE